MSRIAITLAAFAWIARAAQANAESPLLVPATPLVAGAGSGEVVLADIDRDGHLDVVTKHLLRRVISVHLGDGKGHFTPMAEGPMDLGYEPGTMVLGELNGDGHPDLAVASKDHDNEYVRVFLGDGNGSFGAAGSPYATSPSSQGYKPTLRLVDVNEDGHRDILTANGRRNSIETLLGDGVGLFSGGPAVKLETGQDYYSFAIGDVDGDRHLDLLTASTGARGAPDRILLRRGNGRASFGDAAAPMPPVPASPRVMGLTDMDADQDIDVVLSHADRGQLSVLLNTDNGVFVPAAGSPYEIGTEAFAVVVADADGDGRADVLAATVTSVTVLLGDAETFAPAPGSPFPAGPGAYNLAVGDVNEDGRLDVVASSFEGDSVTVLLGGRSAAAEP